MRKNETPWNKEKPKKPPSFSYENATCTRLSDVECTYSRFTGRGLLVAAPAGKPAGERAGTRSLAGDELVESAPQASYHPKTRFQAEKSDLPSCERTGSESVW